MRIFQPQRGHGGCWGGVGVEHTKSSPIGPAEHDEGGSLQDNNQFSRSPSKKQIGIVLEVGVERKRSRIVARLTDQGL